MRNYNFGEKQFSLMSLKAKYIQRKYIFSKNEEESAQN